MDDSLADNLPSNLSPSFEEWVSRALKTYKAAFHAFMSVVRHKLDSQEQIVVESAEFFEALEVTRELLNDDYLFGELRSKLVAPALLEHYEGDIQQLTNKLNSIRESCIEIEGQMCIHPNDFFEFVKLLVDLISELGSDLSKLITRAVEPFNQFIEHFDCEAKIDLVDGQYQLILEEEVSDLREKAENLTSQKLKLESQRLCKSVDEPVVYTIFDMADIVDYTEERWCERLILTPYAKQSLEESVYKDLKRVVKAFDLLGNESYQVFKYSQRMSLMTDKLDELSIEFKPSMSDVSMGRFPVYDRDYKDRKADFNKHLCLGNSRRKENCMRIHFEWDAEDEKIVVHHAGKHLPTGDE